MLGLAGGKVGLQFSGTLGEPFGFSLGDTLLDGLDGAEVRVGRLGVALQAGVRGGNRGELVVLGIDALDETFGVRSGHGWIVRVHLAGDGLQCVHVDISMAGCNGSTLHGSGVRELEASLTESTVQKIVRIENPHGLLLVLKATVGVDADFAIEHLEEVRALLRAGSVDVVQRRCHDSHLAGSLDA